MPIVLAGLLASCGGDAPVRPVGAEIDPQVKAAIKARSADELKRLLERTNTPPSPDVVREVAAQFDPDPARGAAARQMLEVLLERSADPNACWRDGGRTRCLIEVAVGLHDQEAVRILLRYGFQARGEEGCDAFISSVEENDLEMVKLFLEAKVDVNCRGNEDYGTPRTPLSMAIEHRHRELTKRLEDLGAREW
ncbi:MAG: ankyrin repeat domain-containing protein [Bryobacteraceae bacterium]|nr:ankyrin repeat domain-containing protein [Bryobacteraceae bacterium]